MSSGLGPGRAPATERSRACFFIPGCVIQACPGTIRYDTISKYLRMGTNWYEPVLALNPTGTKRYGMKALISYRRAGIDVAPARYDAQRLYRLVLEKTIRYAFGRYGKLSETIRYELVRRGSISLASRGCEEPCCNTDFNKNKRLEQTGIKRYGVTGLHGSTKYGPVCARTANRYVSV